MSCRVLKRGMEDAMLDVLVGDAREAGIHTVVGYYYPTQKNAMVKDFYGRMGFEPMDEDEQGNTTWRLDVDSYEPKKPPMSITR